MDWPAVIRDLTNAGLTQTQIAVLCGVRQTHISYLARGLRKEPGWQLGETLLRLRKKQCLKLKRVEATCSALAATASVRRT